MCEYCKSENFVGNEFLLEFDDGEDKIDTVKVYVTSDGNLYLHNDYGAIVTSINYCPMCGKKLKE